MLSMLSPHGRRGAFMILKLGLIVTVATVVVITAILLYADTRPNVIQVTRSITIQAPAEKIFPLIDDFHRWPGWADLDKEDPTMKRTYSGEESGAGAISDWQGTGNAGKGRMTITESTAPNKVVVKVDFVRPYVTHNLNEFVLEPSAEPSANTATTVTWTMRGPNMFFMKVMGVFVNMDRMLGTHFESGLQNLKLLSES
jgi:hypothetical protein